MPWRLHSAPPSQVKRRIGGLGEHEEHELRPGAARPPRSLCRRHKRRGAPRSIYDEACTRALAGARPIRRRLTRGKQPCLRNGRSPCTDLAEVRSSATLLELFKGGSGPPPSPPGASHPARFPPQRTRCALPDFVVLQPGWLFSW